MYARKNNDGIKHESKNHKQPVTESVREEVRHEEVLNMLYESTKQSLDALYRHARRTLEKQLGSEIKPRSPIRSSLTEREQCSIDGNAYEPFSKLAELELEYVHRPSVKKRLDTLLYGYQYQWFFMRPQDMTGVERKKFLRLLRAFPELDYVYYLKEAFRRDFFDCCKTHEDIVGAAALADLCLGKNKACKPLHDFLEWLPTVTIITE